MHTGMHTDLADATASELLQLFQRGTAPVLRAARAFEPLYPIARTPRPA